MIFQNIEDELDDIGDELDDIQGDVYNFTNKIINSTRYVTKIKESTMILFIFGEFFFIIEIIILFL